MAPMAHRLGGLHATADSDAYPAAEYTAALLGGSGFAPVGALKFLFLPETAWENGGEGAWRMSPKGGASRGGTWHRPRLGRRRTTAGHLTPESLPAARKRGRRHFPAISGMRPSFGGVPVVVLFEGTPSMRIRGAEPFLVERLAVIETWG